MQGNGFSNSDNHRPKLAVTVFFLLEINRHQTEDTRYKILKINRYFNARVVHDLSDDKWMHCDTWYQIRLRLPRQLPDNLSKISFKCISENFTIYSKLAFCVTKYVINQMGYLHLAQRDQLTYSDIWIGIATHPHRLPYHVCADASCEKNHVCLGLRRAKN